MTKKRVTMRNIREVLLTSNLILATATNRYRSVRAVSKYRAEHVQRACEAGLTWLPHLDLDDSVIRSERLVRPQDRNNPPRAVGIQPDWAQPRPRTAPKRVTRRPLWEEHAVSIQTACSTSTFAETVP
jgi:hypothetical protein